MALSKEKKKHIIRGLFASDGTAYLAKINNKKEKLYPIIEYSSKSKELIKQIQKLLEEHNIRTYTWNYKTKYGDQSHIRITGVTQCKKFQEEIGLINPKHILRIKNKLK